LTALPETVANVEFNAFYHAERVPLVRFVMFLGADPDTAEDIVQAAFTRAFPAWHTIRFPQAWLRKVAQSEYFGHCRAAARHTSLDAAPGRADRPAGASAALALEQQAETREVLAAVIADLPPKQRQVMAWHWDGFSDAEIAGELGDSEAAVRKNRSRAMKNLRRLLADERRGAK
jgi:RNA polymerase sigma-70 factor (ECF subfamily)